MVSDDLDRIERDLGIRLPGNYRALVLTYPLGLGASGPDYELLDDPAQIIAINQQFREHGFFGMPWPAHYFSFGGDCAGNAYYLDLRKEPFGIDIHHNRRPLCNVRFGTDETR